MANYTGEKCPVCEKAFISGDDIVVCPVCGAPHHRDCYTEVGHCGLQDKHGDSFEWKSEQSHKQEEPHWENAEGEQGIACPACGSQNPAGGIFCQRCGTRLRDMSAQNPFTQQPGQPPYGANVYGGTQAPPYYNAYNAAFGGVSPDEEIAGINAQDLALFIGPNSHYYLPRFKVLSQGRMVPPNVPVFLLAMLPSLFLILSHFGISTFTVLSVFCTIVPMGAIYFFFRKMYVSGGIITALTYISWIPSLAVTPEVTTYMITHMEDFLNGVIPPAFEPTQHLWAVMISPYLSSLLILVTLVFALMSTRLYFNHTIKHIRKIQSLFTGRATIDNREYTAKLIVQGRVARLPVILMITGSFVLYFAISIPLMKDLFTAIV